MGCAELSMVAALKRHHTHIIWHKLFNSSNKVCYRQFHFIQRHDYAFAAAAFVAYLLIRFLSHSAPFGYTSTIIFSHQFELLVFLPTYILNIMVLAN